MPDQTRQQDLVRRLQAIVQANRNFTYAQPETTEPNATNNQETMRYYIRRQDPDSLTFRHQYAFMRAPDREHAEAYAEAIGWEITRAIRVPDLRRARMIDYLARLDRTGEDRGMMFFAQDEYQGSHYFRAASLEEAREAREENNGLIPPPRDLTRQQAQHLGRANLIVVPEAEDSTLSHTATLGPSPDPDAEDTQPSPSPLPEDPLTEDEILQINRSEGERTAAVDLKRGDRIRTPEGSQRITLLEPHDGLDNHHKVYLEDGSSFLIPSTLTPDNLAIAPTVLKRVVREPVQDQPIFRNVGMDCPSHCQQPASPACFTENE